MRTFRRACVLVLALGLALTTGCRRSGPPPDGGATSARAKKGRKDAEELALGAVAGAAQAQVKAGVVEGVPPPPPPRPGPVPVLRERVSGPPHPTEAEADEAAAALAAAAVEHRLAEMDPPVRAAVTPAAVRAAYLRTDTRTVRAAPGGVAVAYDVEVTAEQVRDLRARERLVPVLSAFGGLGLVALAAAAVLRTGTRPRPAV